EEVYDMKGQTYVIFSIIFVIIISVFAVLNIDEVEVNYLFWSGSSPLIFVILFSVLLGGILTIVVGSKKFITLKRENKQLHDRIKKLGLETNKTAMSLENNDQEDGANIEDTTKKDEKKSMCPLLK